MIIKDKEKVSILDKDDFQIDIKKFLIILYRNRNLIFKLSLSTIFISSIYCFTAKRLWKGEFQIVLEQKSIDFPNVSLPSSISSEIIPEIDSFKANIKTEAEILKSPSVLNDVFEFVKNKKVNNGNSKYNPSFKVWRDNSLFIDLKKGTSVLTISFEDNDKEIILPVLSKISNAYQKYSGKNKRRTQELTNNFFKEQISIFKKNSASSLRAAQEFAIDQDLVFYDLGKETQNNIENNPGQFLGNNTLQAPNLLLPNIGIENARVQAANQIRKINLQLLKIKELNNSEELQYIGATIPALVAEGLPKALSDIEAELLAARSKYTDKDITIVNLIKRRNLAIDLLKNRTIKYLEVQKLDAQATMKATMRPKGVLLKYKELIREAGRDEQTLIQLENQFNLFKLDLASQQDPWELITIPTLLTKPISPNVPLILFISPFIGIFFGILIAAIIEKVENKALIIDDMYLEESWSCIIGLKPFGEKNWLESLKIFLNQDFNPNSKKVAIYPMGEFKEKENNEIKNLFKNQASATQFDLINEINLLNKYSKIFVLAKLWEVKKSELSDLNNQIKINNKLSDIYLIVLSQNIYKNSFLFRNFNKLINLIKKLN